jgi:signal transduction histidine kinase
VRTRLLGIVVSLVVLIVLGLGLPLALAVANGQRQDLFLDRLTDTSRFSSLAQRPITDDQPQLLADKLRRYEEVYGIRAALLDRDGTVVVNSGTSVDLADEQVADAVSKALAGRQAEHDALRLPWDTRPMVLAEPILVDGEVRGATVTVSSTEAMRDRVLRRWGLVAVGCALALGVAVFLALPVVRWVLRPVRRLDDATASLSAAVVSGRAVEPVGDKSGPPELRQLGRSFDRMAATVNEVLAAQRAFVADGSHQLRNPLTALRLRLGNLEGQVHESGVEDQEAAVAEAARLNRILDEMLTMARAENSTAAPVPVAVDEVVADRLAAWNVVAESRRVLLSYSGTAGGAVLLPPRGLESILDALLDNALKFTYEDTEVVVAVSRSDDGVRISVRDNGPGLEPDELERATDRFWRSPAHQNVTGSGLGLSIVRRIAERVAGTVTLDLPAAGGLRVTVLIPS